MTDINIVINQIRELEQEDFESVSKMIGHNRNNYSYVLKKIFNFRHRQSVYLDLIHDTDLFDDRSVLRSEFESQMRNHENYLYEIETETFYHLNNER